MAVLIIQDYLNKGNLQSALGRYADAESFPYMKYILHFRLSDLQLSFVRIISIRMTFAKSLTV